MTSAALATCRDDTDSGVDGELLCLTNTVVLATWRAKLSKRNHYASRDEDGAAPPPW